jgi:pyridoxine 4-dehydrogenase
MRSAFKNGGLNTVFVVTLAVINTNNGDINMNSTATKLGMSFTLPGTTITLNRLGYGAMQLAGEGVGGPPRDPDAAVAVLSEAVSLGVNHIDTSELYGPPSTNQIIRKAFHPYPKGLAIVTKVGFRRGADKSRLSALSTEELTAAVHDYLRNFGLEALEVVNRRVGGFAGPTEGSIAEPLSGLIKLKEQGFTTHSELRM